MTYLQPGAGRKEVRVQILSNAGDRTRVRLLEPVSLYGKLYQRGEIARVRTDKLVEREGAAQAVDSEAR